MNLKRINCDHVFKTAAISFTSVNILERFGKYVEIRWFYASKRTKIFSVPLRRLTDEIYSRLCFKISKLFETLFRKMYALFLMVLCE